LKLEIEISSIILFQARIDFELYKDYAIVFFLS